MKTLKLKSQHFPISSLLDLKSIFLLFNYKTTGIDQLFWFQKIVKINYKIVFKLNFMKAVSTLPENIAICIFYTVFSLLVFYIYKQTVKPVQVQNKSQSRNPEYYESQLKDKTLLYAMGKTALLKFTFASILNKDKKHFLVELLILSIFGTCCLHINHIIIWPCSIGFILVGIAYSVRQLGVHFFGKYQIGDTSDIPQQIMNQNHIQSNVQIEVCHIRTETGNQLKLRTFNDKNKMTLTHKCTFQVLFLFTCATSSLVLMSYTIFTLCASISNSGYLNFMSVLIIFCLDLAIRIGISSTLISVMFVLNFTNLIRFKNNRAVQYICQQQIAEQKLFLYQKMRKRQLQLTAAKGRLLNQEISNNGTNNDESGLKETQQVDQNIHQPQTGKKEEQGKKDTEEKVSDTIIQKHRQKATQQGMRNAKNNQVINIDLDNYEITSPQRRTYQNPSQKQFSNINQTQKATIQTDRTQIDRVRQSSFIRQEQNVIRNRKNMLFTSHLDLNTIDSQIQAQKTNLSPQSQQMQNVLTNQQASSNGNASLRRRQLQISGVSPYLVDLTKEIKPRRQNRNNRNKENVHTQNAFYPRHHRNQQN